MQNIEKKQVCVFGLGTSGISAIRLLNSPGAQVYAINEGDPREWPNWAEISKLVPEERCFAQNEVKEAFGAADLVILSPGIPRDHPVLEGVNNKKIPIWNEIELALQYLSAPVIGITGTNGKTTITTLLGDLIAASGKKVFVGGNIGTPLCECVLAGESPDWIVLELSSFQLESIFSLKPKVGIISNLSFSHGERYGSLSTYGAAKLRILDGMGQDDLFLYDGNPQVAKALESKSVQREVIDDSGLRGELSPVFVGHNLLNLNFCVKTLEFLGLSVSEEVLKSFRGVPYRMELIHNSSSKMIFNDAKSTNWQATLSAIKMASAAKNEKQKISLILGGKLRGEGDSISSAFPVIDSLVDKIFLVGESQESLAKELSALGCNRHRRCSKLEDVFNDEPNEVVVFSPAFPSFDEYKNYIERGARFTELVEKLFN